MQNHLVFLGGSLRSDLLIQGHTFRSPFSGEWDESASLKMLVVSEATMMSALLREGQELSWSLSWFLMDSATPRIFTTSYFRDNGIIEIRKISFFFFGGASQGPIRYAGRYVASAAVSSRCLKPTERILEVNKETDIRDSIPWTEGCLEMLKFLGMNLQKFIWRLFGGDLVPFRGVGFWNWMGCSPEWIRDKE